jgi:hypothetical protein
MRGAFGVALGCCLLLPGCGKATGNKPAPPIGSAGLGGASDDGTGDSGASSGGTTWGEGGAPGEEGGAGAAVVGGGAAGEEGGTAEEGGAPASGGAGSVRPDGCVDFSHFEYGPRMTWDLQVLGTGFEADEGDRVRVVVTYTGEPSYALAESTIQSGSFDIAMPGIIEPYTGIGVYIDEERNDACDVDVDKLFTLTTGGVFGDFVWEITPDEPDPAGAAPCYINGIFDLTTALPCPE